jgi:LPXTG-site transpeptidase (sortase) family protein
MQLSTKQFNRFIFGAIVLANSLTMLLVFHPSLVYWWQSQFGNRREHLEQLVQNDTPAGNYSRENKIVIPTMLLDEKIFTGKDSQELKKGVWLRPNSSIPGEGSNIVMAGHRTAYSRSPVFYHLNKLQIDDAVIVFWQGEKHLYRVDAIREVSPWEIDIEQPTKKEQLTLYTCTPLGTSWRRLVVTAKEVAS